MGWQELAVALIVAAAVLYLVSRFVSLRRRKKAPAQTFVPLSRIKRSTPEDDRPACH